jgi:hypothetical protein
MGRHNAFAFPYTFFRERAEEVIPQLQEVGFTGINLALNYHASRDFLLRQGPELHYLADGFHYYAPELSRYPDGAITPNPSDCTPTNQMLDGVLTIAATQNFEINAWAVFMHNSAIGFRQPEVTVTNCFGNHFLSELCPSSPQIAGYISGLTADLSSRGITSLAIESLHFHGAHHGEHHERFFLEMGEVTSFLLALCFCASCIENFSGDGESLKNKVAQALQPFLDDGDSWLGAALTKENLAEIIGAEILDYLSSREETVAARYREVQKIATEHGVKTKFVDQAPLLPGSASAPLDKSWQVGINNELINQIVDIYEPLIYRSTPDEVAQVGGHYRKLVTSDITAILRPTFPDNQSERSLIEKVIRLKSAGITDVDFYLLDAMRPRDLTWITSAITS